MRISWGSLIIRCIGAGLIAWPLVQNLISYRPLFSRARFEGLFPMLLGAQLLVVGVVLDRPGRKAGDLAFMALLITALAVCWLTGQLVLAVIVFLLQLPFAFRKDADWRRRPKN